MSWATMERRVNEARSRAAVRAWRYRQRNHAAGVWYRLRGALADAEYAWSVPIEAGERLSAQGFVPDPVGAELVPPRLILWVSAAVAAGVPGARRVEIALAAELLGTPCLLLVPFRSRAAARGVPDG